MNDRFTLCNVQKSAPRGAFLQKSPPRRAGCVLSLYKSAPVAIIEEKVRKKGNACL